MACGTTSITRALLHTYHSSRMLHHNPVTQLTPNPNGSLKCVQNILNQTFSIQAVSFNECYKSFLCTCILDIHIPNHNCHQLFYCCPWTHLQATVVDYSQQLRKAAVKIAEVESHGNNVRDVIVAHVISADAHTYIHIYIHTWKPQSNLRTSQPRTAGW